jgi:hypothetical protein
MTLKLCFIKVHDVGLIAFLMPNKNLAIELIEAL